ncbi:hypothetical protein PIB30_047193 [Stylosanthes scabra]|uniref:Glycosyltransferase n=1 Tax=Stylosanthes scabra TaxID=79078 RepID=A0ABU6SGH9_9FABA|nr:hypothetical protein [Stylosanthes scabra]
MDTTNNNKKPHAAILTSPGMGHLIPAVELGKTLLTKHAFDVTIFLITTDPAIARSQINQQTSHLKTPPNVVELPQPDVSSKLGPQPSIVDRIVVTMTESIPSLRSFILSMNHPPSLLIIDLFGTAAIPMARDLGMQSYVFLTMSAWFSALTIYLPAMDPIHVENTHIKNREPLPIPGCEPLLFDDTLESLLDPHGPMYEGYTNVAKVINGSDGILMNTWQDLEPSATKALGESGILRRFTKGPVYPVGPLVRTLVERDTAGLELDNKVKQWLDRQPTESVIYVSFGSGGTMSAAQIRELAWGLELSMLRFVWVVRPPLDDDVSGAFFDVGKGGDGLPEYLPEGFLERTKELGVVVPMWAPQVEILGHPATGGFVTHCGWNSVVEAIFGEVAMVAWPLYSEQTMNAAMLSEDIGVAVRANKAEDGVVGRDEIARVVRRVMVEEEGGEMREKVKKLKASAEKAVCEFGSSYESLGQFRRNCCELHLRRGEDAKARGA